ncbi:MAG: hypothetical protein MMC33_000060 [Icmadophila ericetorum]|nr:hypothetical protein [Icmadophila ericetorum]
MGTWMMTDATLHTPLEVLLFFQAIRTHGVDTTAFSKISESLKSDEFILQSGTYDANRLGPESLRQLYIKLVKEEAQAGIKREKTSAKVDEQVASRERKISPPPMHSVEATSEHLHLVPQLANRLFVDYRDDAIKFIEDEETKYKALTKDIKEIEAGEWDARLQEQANLSKKEPRGVSSIQTLLRHDIAEDEQAADAIQQDPNLKDRPDGGKPDTAQKEPAAAAVESDEVHAKPHGLEETKASSHEPPQHSRTSSGGSKQQGYSPHQEDVQKLSRPPSQSRMAETHPPHLPPIGYGMASPTTEVHRRLTLQHAPMSAPLSASPHLSQMPLLPPDRASPIILPPPPGMLRSSGSPTGPLDALADIAGQQYNSNPAILSPRHPQGMGSPQHPKQLPQPRNPYPYYPNNQVQYNTGYSPYSQHPPNYHSPIQGNPPPYPQAKHGQVPPLRPQNLHQYQAPGPQFSPYGYPSAQTPYQSPTLVGMTSQNRIPSQFQTPRDRPRPSPILTSASSTKWKKMSDVDWSHPPKSPTPPRSRDISPISDRAPSPPPDLPKSQAKEKPVEVSPAKKPAVPVPPRRGRGNRARGTKGFIRGSRADSTASSALAGSARTRTRSQSIISQPDELSIDTNLISSRKIKPEPPATPANDTPRPGIKRKRADTIEEPPVPATTFIPSAPKATHILASRNFPRTSNTLMNTISGHKFANMFAKPVTERDAPSYKDLIYVGQDLKSIKSAISAGSRAVATALDTPGAEDGVAASPATKSSTQPVLLEVNKDVIPPKGIVNSEQLEKEICRIFSNAVMFNPDSKRGVGPAFHTRAKAKVLAEKKAMAKVARMLRRSATVGTHDSDAEDDEDEEDKDDEDEDGGASQEEEEEAGLVHDTREMFEAVEQSLTNWRSAERAAEGKRLVSVQIPVLPPRASTGGTGAGGDDTAEDEGVDEIGGGGGAGDGKGTVKRRRRG